MQMLKNAGLKGRWAFEIFGLAWPGQPDSPLKPLCRPGLLGTVPVAKTCCGGLKWNLEHLLNMTPVLVQSRRMSLRGETGPFTESHPQ